MKRRLLMAMVSVFALRGLLAVGVHAKQTRPPFRTIAPIIATDWLEDHLNQEGLVIVDIRDPGAYGLGHIPGSINEPFVTGFDPCKGPSSNWIIGSDDCLWLQVPDVNDLLITIGNLGISRNSRVVVVTAPNPGDPPF